MQCQKIIVTVLAFGFCISNKNYLCGQKKYAKHDQKGMRMQEEVLLIALKEGASDQKLSYRLIDFNM
jgi:hypothetical protein